MRSERLTVLFSPNELHVVKQLARVQGENMSVVVRQAVRQVARQEGLTEKSKDTGLVSEAKPVSLEPIQPAQAREDIPPMRAPERTLQL